MPRCEKCPFRTGIVEGEIRPAKLLIVGEAPAKNELREGKPFVGKSGRLLWEVLRRFGVERDEVAVTNSLCCHIPDYLYSKKASILKEPIQACRQRLFEEILTVQPRLILSLGNVALHALTGDHNLKITHERGDLKTLHVPPEYTNGSGPFETYMLATLHPAAVLRNVMDLKKMAVDCSYACQVAAGGELKDPGPTRYKVIRPGQWGIAQWYLDRYRQAGNTSLALGADIETDNLDPLSGTILALGISPVEGFTLIFPKDTINDPATKRWLTEIFASKNYQWIWHNGKFDTKFLAHEGFSARVDHDTILEHYALDEQKGSHDLKQLSTHILGAGDYGGKFKKFLAPGQSFASAPKDALYTYLSKDADYTRRLHHILLPKVQADPELDSLYHRILLPLTPFLQRVEQNGMPLSIEATKKLETELEGEKEIVATNIHEMTRGYWDEIDYKMETGAKSAEELFNPGSTAQLAWMLYKSMRLRPTNGRIDTQEDTLKSIESSPFVDEILKYRKLSKQLGTYVYGMQKALATDDRIHTTFKIPGTTTGRLSSAEPNLQNIPRKSSIKNIFVAPDGRTMIELDLDQAEIRMLAHMSGDPILIQVFADKRDVHSETALKVFGPEFTGEQRTAAKSVNFGIMYGLTEYGLLQGLASQDPPIKVSFRFAAKMIDGWRETYPVAAAWLQSQRDLPMKGKPAVSVFGRKRRFPLVTKESMNEIQNEASNHGIQSSASDLNLIYAMHLEPKLQEFYAKIINLVHDSILIECPDDPKIIDQVIRLAKESLSWASRVKLGAKFDFTSSAKVGREWGSLSKYVEKVPEYAPQEVV